MECNTSHVIRPFGQATSGLVGYSPTIHTVHAMHWMAEGSRGFCGISSDMWGKSNIVLMPRARWVTGANTQHQPIEKPFLRIRRYATNRVTLLKNRVAGRSHFVRPVDTGWLMGDPFIMLINTERVYRFSFGGKKVNHVNSIARKPSKNSHTQYLTGSSLADLILPLIDTVSFTKSL